MDMNKATHSLMITVDVEALPKRAQTDHVTRLIFGEVDGKSFGIGRMMDVADEFQAKIVFMVDMAEYFLHGEPILDACRLVLDRGHDLQLHCHSDIIPAETWSHMVPGIRQHSLNRLPFEACDILLARFGELAARISDQPMIGYRGGAFRYSKGWLDALRKHGYRVSANYFPALKHQTFNCGDLGIFRWEGDLIELPLTTYFDSALSRQRRFELNAWRVAEIPHAIDLAINQMKEPKAPMCLLMHSWSFCDQDELGHYVYKNSYWIDAFRTLLWHLADKNVATVACADLARGVDSGEIPGGPIFHTSQVPEPEATFDAIHNTDTHAKVALAGLTITSPNAQFGHEYQPTPEGVLVRAISFLDIVPAQFTFVDIGCGKGRTLICAAEMKFRSIVGVEFAVELAEVARENIARLHIENASVWLGDALDYPTPDDDLVIYLYNPFARPVLEAFLDKLSREARRRLYLVYRGPLGFEAVAACPEFAYMGSPPGDGGPTGIHVWRLAAAEGAGDRPRPQIAKDFDLKPFETVWIETPEASGDRIVVALTFRQEEPVVKNAIVCAFDLGAPVSDEFVSAAHLMRSHRFPVFDYMPAPRQGLGEGVWTTQIAVTLPEAAELRRIGLARWNAAGPIHILSCSIKTARPASLAALAGA